MVPYNHLWEILFIRYYIICGAVKLYCFIVLLNILYTVSLLHVAKPVLCVFQQSTEVKNSNAMELEALKRNLRYLEENNVHLQKLVTDRHVQVSTYMANEQPEVEHCYDVWHVAKGK